MPGSARSSRPPLVRRTADRGRSLLTAVHLGLVLVVVELGVRVVPLPRLAALLGVRFADDTLVEGHDPTSGPSPPLTRAEARRLGVADRLVRHWPFAGGPCLRESLLRGHALRGRSPQLRLGVARTRDTVEAHAWIEASGACYGYDGRFTPLQRAR